MTDPDQDLIDLDTTSRAADLTPIGSRDSQHLAAHPDRPSPAMGLDGLADDNEDDDVIPRRISLRQALSFKNISAVYIWIILVAVFSWLRPNTFPTMTTFKTVLSQESVTAILAVGLVVPLAAGVYDLSVGYALGASSITAAWFMVTAQHSAILAIIMAAALGTVVGIINGALVVKMRINSFIATMAMSSVLAAYITFRSDNNQIIGLPDGFKRLATNETFGIAWSVYLLLALAVVIWYVLEHRPVGRHVYATGGNSEAARLAGVRTNRVIWGSLIASSVIAAVAGVVLTARIGVGSPSIGPPYLLPAFAAAFLGSTQLRNGRFNVWGTIIAVYVLATGVKGLQLLGARFWLPDLFNGLALAVAVGIAGFERRGFRRVNRRSETGDGRSTARRRLLGRVGVGR